MRTLASLLALALTVLANGVLEAEGPVRLTAHRVAADVFDRVAEVTVEHTFLNDGPRRLEGRYVFPLPRGATVSSFAMTMNGKMVEGKVYERGRAKRVYENIVRREKDPGLLEKVSDGVFRARVFPIEPRAPLTIRLVYQQILPEDAGMLELRYPLAAQRLGGDAARNVSIAVDVESTVDLRTVYCPSHDAEVVRDGKRRARAAWEGGRTDGDFLLYVGRGEDAVAFTLLSHRRAGERGTFLAVLAPVAKAKPEDILPKDVVYVLDVSGSMKGEKIAQAKAALRFGIESLREGDRFDVVAFSTEVRPFRDGPVEGTPRNRKAALAWIDGLEAAGGTALDEALQRSLSMARGERLPIVTLLTDGLPSVGVRSPNDIVARVGEANRASARVFVFGVGFDQNVAFLDRIARMTRAAREYITPGQDIEVAVSRFFRRIDQPVLSDLELDLGEGVEEVYPRALPDLFAGDQLVVMGRYRESGPRAIRLTGRLRGEETTYVYEGALAAKREIPALPRLWAERKVEFLDEQLRLHGHSRELVDEVVRLGTKHSIVTRYTSGLVVETDEIVLDTDFEETAGEDGLSDTPFTGPSTNSAIGLGGGAGGIRRRLRAAGGGSAVARTAVDRGLKWLARHQAKDGSWNDPERTSWAVLTFLGAGFTDRGSVRENPHAKTVREGLRYLIAVQRADGSFGDDVLGHAMATLAFCEAFWMTRNPRYKVRAQWALNRLARTRTPRGGWKEGTIADAYCVAALKAGKLAGLEVDPDAFEGARRALMAASPKTSAECAGIVLARILMGEDPRGSESLEALARRVETDAADLHNVSLGTLAKFQMGGAAWRTWNAWMKGAIAESQHKDGGWPDAPGLIATAARLQALQVYYRYDRVWGVR